MRAYNNYSVDILDVMCRFCRFYGLSYDKFLDMPWILFLSFQEWMNANEKKDAK